MKMTIYLPEDLAEKVKDHADLNVSAVCQDALRRELTRRAELEKLDEGMERVKVYIDRLGSDAAFVGKVLYATDHPWGNLTAYLTRRHRIAIYNDDAQDLVQFDSFDDLAADPGWRDNDPELVGAVAAALGEEFVIELDI
jgi:post-segregation antitoxin (ccd killing protein)